MRVGAGYLVLVLLSGFPPPERSPCEGWCPPSQRLVLPPPENRLLRVAVRPVCYSDGRRAAIPVASENSEILPKTQCDMTLFPQIRGPRTFGINQPLMGVVNDRR